MKDYDPRDLSALLAERPPLERSAEGLLALLAAADHGDITALTARLSADDVEWDALVDWVSDWPDPSVDVGALRAWLRETEDLGRAEVGLARLGVARADETRQAITARLEPMRAAIDARNDHALYAGEATRRAAVPPWTWIRRGTLAGLLDDAAAWSEVLRLATRAELSAEDEALFAREVRARGALMERYRDHVRASIATIHVTRWTAAWSLDVARDERELESAAELLRVHLPHAEGALVVRQHEAGTWWRSPRGTSALVPYDARMHRVEDALLGTLETAIEVHTPTADQDAWHGVASLMRVADGEGEERGLEVARTLADAIAHGPMSDAIAAAHHAFDIGEDLDDEAERLVSHALTARLLMSEAAARLDAQDVDVAPLMEALARADERHREHRSASFMVPDDVHDDLVEAHPTDPKEWWGHRAAVERVVPPGVVESALTSLADSRGNVVSIERARARFARSPSLREGLGEGPQEATRDEPRRAGNLYSLAARRAASEAVTRLAAAPPPSLRPNLPREPAPWLRDPRHAPTPGRVPVVLYDEANDRGILAELRVHIGDMPRDAETWASAETLERIARDSIRDAYFAAAACTKQKIAPHAFATHRLELVVDGMADDTYLAVEGRSIGLAAALAFASAWLDRPIAREMVPMAAVARWGGVAPVGAVRQKASAVEGATFLVHEKNVADLEAGRARVVANLDEALEAAGLALGELGVTVVPERKRLERLRELVGIVETGDLKRLHERARWTDAGDELRAIVDTFGKVTPHAAALDHARVMAALAYSHAGAITDMSAMLGNVNRAACASVETRTLKDIVALGALIDRQQLESDAAREAIAHLEADISELRSGEPTMLGRALGTLGRAHMHRNGDGDPERALPLLAEAITAHAAHEKHEVARSRMYYAMALRTSGEKDAALDQLVQAQRDLETLTRAYSEEYEASCRVYVEYELARTLVALGRYEDAIGPAERALKDCEWQAWPQLGLLRVHAWASRMLGDDEAAAADVARMRELAPAMPHHAELVQRLIEEAEGYPNDNGEVY